MTSKSALLFIFISVAAVLALAIPGSMYDAPVARRGLEQRDITTLNWAGAVLIISPGSVNSVSASFLVPSPSLDQDRIISILVGIDGYTCQTAFVQAGITLIISGHQVQYQALRVPAPSISETFSLDMKAGDNITASIATYNRKSALVMVENHRSGGLAYNNLTGLNELCEQEAEWIVEDYMTDLSDDLDNNFTKMTFEYPVAAGTTTYALEDVKVLAVRPGNQTIAYGEIGNNNSTIEVSFL